MYKQMRSIYTCDNKVTYKVYSFKLYIYIYIYMILNQKTHKGLICYKTQTNQINLWIQEFIIRNHTITASNFQEKMAAMTMRLLYFISYHAIQQ